MHSSLYLLPADCFIFCKLRSIIEQSERCQGEGEIGALLRREGLYSSHLSNWRRAKRQGTLQAIKSQPRSPAAAVDAASQREKPRIDDENLTLEAHV